MTTSPHRLSDGDELAQLKALINYDGSLTTFEEHVDILRDAMAALEQLGTLHDMHEALYAWERIRPDCVGEWVSGSGGHRVHGKCSEKATWFDFDDAFAYCDQHVPESDRTRGDYQHFPKRHLPRDPTGLRILSPTISPSTSHE